MSEKPVSNPNLWQSAIYVLTGFMVTIGVLGAIATIAAATVMLGILVIFAADASPRELVLPFLQARVPAIALFTTFWWGLLTYTQLIARKIGLGMVYVTGAIAVFSMIMSLAA